MGELVADGTVIAKHVLAFGRDEMEECARALDVLEEAVAQAVPLGGALARDAILLSADTGMLESPKIVNRRTVQVSALIQPGLVPGQQVVLQSQVIGGTWRISEAEYAGDTHGNDWTVALTMHRPLPPLVGAPVTGGIGP